MVARKGSPLDVRNVLSEARNRGRMRQGRGRFSEVYVWMWSGWDDLAAEMGRPDAPSWEDVADRLRELADQGFPVRDGKGGPPSADTLRKTFSKVRLAKRAGGKKGRESGPAPQAPAVEARPVVVAEDAAGARDDPRGADAEGHNFGGKRSSAMTPPRKQRDEG